MIPEEKLKQIVEQLREKTLKDQVEWAANIRNPGIEERYTLALGKSEIRLSYDSPATEPDQITFRISSTATDSRVPVGSLYAEELDGENWKLLSALRDAIFQKVTKWDEVLEEIDNALKSTGSIGAPF